MKIFKNLVYLVSIVLISTYCLGQKTGETLRLTTHLQVKSFDNISGDNTDSVRYLEPLIFLLD